MSRSLVNGFWPVSRLFGHFSTRQIHRASLTISEFSSEKISFASLTLTVEIEEKDPKSSLASNRVIPVPRSCSVEMSEAAASSSTQPQGGLSRRGGYTRIGQSENANPVSPSAAAVDAAEARRKRKQTIERLSNKMHAAMWVIAAALVLYYTRLPSLVFASDSKALGWAIDLGFVSLGVALAIAFYCIVWIRIVQGIDLDWAVVAPGMVPAATISGICSLLL
jgi:hypothetical protein